MDIQVASRVSPNFTDWKFDSRDRMASVLREYFRIPGVIVTNEGVYVPDNLNKLVCVSCPASNGEIGLSQEAKEIFKPASTKK